jgi:hypothetical protein
MHGTLLHGVAYLARYRNINGEVQQFLQEILSFWDMIEGREREELRKRVT